MRIYQVYEQWPQIEVGKFSSMRAAKRITKALQEWTIAVGEKKEGNVTWLSIIHNQDTNKKSIFRTYSFNDLYPSALRKQILIKKFVKSGCK